MKKGETLKTLAKQFLGGEKNVDRLLAFNDYKEDKVLRVGEWVKIPPYFEKKDKEENKKEDKK